MNGLEFLREVGLDYSFLTEEFNNLDLSDVMTVEKEWAEIDLFFTMVLSSVLGWGALSCTCLSEFMSSSLDLFAN